MRRLRWPLTVWMLFVLAWLAPRGVAAENGLAAKLEAVINGPAYKQAHWGLLVVEAETGKTVYAHNADKLFMPASTTKLYSTATALAAYGPDYKFETPVYRRGEVKNGRLQGDLILVASGDPTLGGRNTADGKMAFKDHDHIYANSPLGRSEVTDTDPLAGLKDVARQIAAAGIKHIQGDVLIDERLFVKNRGSGSGPDLLTPIVVNDNIVDILIEPAGERGQPARVRMRPETSFIRMDAVVTTSAAGTSVNLQVNQVGPQRFTVRGQIPVDAKPQVRIYAVDEPAGFARALFIETLRREGVTVSASPLQPSQGELPEKASYAKLPRVAVHTSLPFSELAKVTLKVSHNLYASLLPLLVAVKQGKTTLNEGMRLQGKFLADLGLEVETISFGGGAGGSGADCVTPRATVQLLQGMAKRPEYKVFHAGLPVLGVDGTLEDAVPADSPARGKAQAKTGTYAWFDLMNDRGLLTSKASAGTLTTAGGKQLLFAIFVNKVPLPKGVMPTREGKVLGKLCEIIYQHGP